MIARKLQVTRPARIADRRNNKIPDQITWHLRCSPVSLVFRIGIGTEVPDNSQKEIAELDSSTAISYWIDPVYASY